MSYPASLESGSLQVVQRIVTTLIVLLLSRSGFGDTAASLLDKLPPPAAKKVDFAIDIKPLLAKSCFQCHGADKEEAGLRVDVRKLAMKGADSGPVILPGKSAESRLIQLVAGADHDVGRMPPEDAGEALSAEQIGLLRAWIDQGASWPDSADSAIEVRKGKDLWSLQAIHHPNPPQTQSKSWVRSPIDSFILEKLEHEHVVPSPEADPTTLLRRVYLDLTGLPPSPDDVRSFLADHRSDAYERVVDRLLESPHFGERWGRHWLDLAHYADSDGYEKDLGRPFAWRYRDWVIQAINEDMPFDEFTVQQLAGDLLTTKDPEYEENAPVGSGFQRNTLINKEGGVDPEEDRVKRTIDRTNTLGAVWLGLTVGCANCHTHKYDPISQQEYFQLYAFFNNLREVDLPVAPSPKENNEFQAVAEAKDKRETYVHLRGDFLSKGPPVMPQTLEALPPLHARGDRPDRLDLARWLVSAEHPLTARVVVNRVWQSYFGRGIVATCEDFGTQGEAPSHPELLDWLASDLRSNGWRMKRLHRLIVTSATYRQSSKARPELTDRDPYNTWLARQNRLRVEAEIIRDLALATAGLLNPEVCGPSIHPPQPAGVSDVTFDNSAKWVESTGADRYRRGLYIWFQRTSPYPSLVGFDAPEAILPCTCRDRSDTPLQSLTLLNDSVFVESTHATAQRMMMQFPPSAAEPDREMDERIKFVYEVALSREPLAVELASLRNLYAGVRDHYRSNSIAAKQLIASLPNNAFLVGGLAHDDASAEMGACIAVARAILNLDEFITRE
jgi:mono/diheme cytochrome c family protein